VTGRRGLVAALWLVLLAAPVAGQTATPKLKSVPLFRRVPLSGAQARLGNSKLKLAEASSAASQEGSQTETGVEEAHENHVSLLIGATTNLSHDETSFTLGVDYERRLNPRWGTGLFGEVTFADETEVIIGVPAIHHLKGGIDLIAGIGAEFVDGESEFLLRLGGAYKVERKGLSIGPFLYWDTVSGDSALVYGLGIGKSF
jgi:hypothetical protein